MRIIAILIILLMFSSLKADDYKTEKVESENGFPSHLIYKIYQDSKGFIWYGTMYGLYRYDGVNYKAFHYDPSDSTSIGNDDVISIFEDSKGNLWFGTYMGGVSRYNPSTSSFTRYIHSENTNSICDNTVWTITEDRSGVIWFGTQNGLSKMENNIISTIPVLNFNLQNITIFSLASDKENNLWIGSYRNGLFRFLPDRKTLDRFKRNDQSSDSLNGNIIRGLYCDHSGNLWIGMVMRGMCMIKSDDIKSNNFRFNKSLFDSTKADLGNTTVYNFADDNKENIFISASNKIFKFNPVSSTFEKISLTLSPARSENISIVLDRTGSLWISSYESCLYKVKTVSEFQNFTDVGNVKAIYQDDKNNNIFIGSDAGFFQFYPETGKIKKIELKTHFTSVSNINKDGIGNLLLATDVGIVRIHPDAIEDVLLAGISVTKIIPDGTYYVCATISGLYFINSESKDTVHYSHNTNDIKSISENQILSLYKDNKNNIWAGSFAGLNKFNRNDQSFTHFAKNLNDTNTLSNNYIYSILQKDDNNLYLGTAGGLNIFNTTNNSFTLIKNNGIQNSVINSILPLKNEVWLGTNNGISKLDLNSSTVKNFTRDDGLEGIISNPDAILLTKEGKIISGFRSGFSIFDPNKFPKEIQKPLINFTDLIIYESGKSKNKDISGDNTIELDHDQNNMLINYSLMDFNDPKKNAYSYKLEGSDNGWISAGNKNSVFYSGLNPGKYELIIYGINSAGIKSAEKSMHIIVHPPFWKTLWFYLMIAILFLSMLYAIYKYRLKKNIAIALQLEYAKETEREKWREQASLDYHDELGHKLTRISMYSRRVLKKLNGSAAEFGDDINHIIETSNSLKMSARDLIWSLNPSEDSLFDFITRVNQFAEELIESTSVTYHKSENKNEWQNIDLPMDTKRQLLFIIKEAINNSIKHSGAKNISFEVKQEIDHLTIEIRDDGSGFENNLECSGSGLLNMNKRAKKSGFKLNIETTLLNGTKIAISNISFISHSIKLN